MTAYANAGGQSRALECGLVFFHLSIMRNMQEAVRKVIMDPLCACRGGGSVARLPAGFVPKYYISLLYDLASCVNVMFWPNRQD